MISMLVARRAGAAPWPGARRWVGCALLALSSAACASSRLEVGPDHPASAQAPLAQMAQVGSALDPGFEPQAEPPRTPSGQDGASDSPTLWTCPMHPEIVRKEPGNCPICGMKLVPVPPKAPPKGSP